MSQQAASSEYKQRLINTQKTVLIQQINRLTDRGLPPTSSIIRSFTEEIIQGPVNKNWTGDFIWRYKNKLTSLYLRNIDSQRTKAEYPPIFKYFYILVVLNF